MSRRMLGPDVVPGIIQVHIPDRVIDILDDAERELADRASAEDHGCHGYFNPNDNLPLSKLVEAYWNKHETYEVGNDYHFSWLRFSHGRRPGLPTYHLDADKYTGLIGEDLNSNLVPRIPVWRLLVNLHRSAERHLAYLNVEPNDLHWHREAGNIGLAADEEIETYEEQILTIPPREDMEAWAAIICVSHVGHAGMETEKGHFLGSWSREGKAA